MMRRAIAAAVVVGAVIFGITQASASQLIVNAPNNLAQMAEEPCTSATINVVGEDKKGQSHNYGEVNVRDVPSSCAGLPLTFVLYNSSGGVVVTRTAAATAGDNVFLINGNYNGPNVEGARLLIGTWPIAATWSLDEPPPPALFSNCVGVDYEGDDVDCTITMVANLGWGDTSGSNDWWAREFLVTPSVASWSADFNMDAVDWISFDPTWLGSSGTFDASSCNLPQASLQSSSGSWGGHLVFRESGPAPGFATVCP